MQRTKGRNISPTDLNRHSDCIGHLDESHLLHAMRLIPDAQILSDEALLKLASTVFLAERFQGYSGGCWVGVIGEGASLATADDR